MHIIKIVPAPLIDSGNYPVIFASDIARADRMPNGLVNLTLIEDRVSCDGAPERHVVGRIIRPICSVVLALYSVVSAVVQ